MTSLKSVKALGKAVLKRAACDFGIWLCGFDEDDKEVQKEKDGYLKLKVKHDAVIQAWKKEQRGR